MTASKENPAHFKMTRAPRIERHPPIARRGYPPIARRGYPPLARGGKKLILDEICHGKLWTPKSAMAIALGTGRPAMVKHCSETGHLKKSCPKSGNPLSLAREPPPPARGGQKLTLAEISYGTLWTPKFHGGPYEPLNYVQYDRIQGKPRAL